MKKVSKVLTVINIITKIIAIVLMIRAMIKDSK